MCLGPGTLLSACEGAPGQGDLDDQPLRVLVLRGDDTTYDLVKYTGQPFVAISYSWPGADTFKRLGTSNTPTVIRTPAGSVASTHFSRFVARSCEAYNAGSHRTVWIDYHCINQSDENEKMAQVAIFQKIYARSETTLIMLEDVALTIEEFRALLKGKATEQTAALVHRVLSARWFSRAWCSQELVLSRRAIFFLHNTSTPGEAHRIDSDRLWHCIEIARRHDSSIPSFSQPRGSVRDDLVSKNTSWALRIVQPLGCSDEYDKLSLVCNLIRHVYRFTARPSAFNAPPSSAATLQLNVLKMANVMAIARGEFSLLVANHGPENPLQGEFGFGWAGVPVHGDGYSDVWLQKDYEVARDPDVAIDGGGLAIRGILAKVEREVAWEVARDGTGLHATIDGGTPFAVAEFTSNECWTWSDERVGLRDLLTVLAGIAHIHSNAHSADVLSHARIALAYVLADPDYQVQPEPITGDVTSLVQGILGEAVGQLQHIATALKFIHRAGARMAFSTVLLSEGSVLLLSGNAPQGQLRGRLLFQPFVVRPKLFSPPMAMTANSMILDNTPLDGPKETYRCIGCVRGLGMTLETPQNAERRLRVV
ncbi:heterokaryon incompatibility protein-domain-containing protein [Ganoderma leucocontextum]|nr:heterokaryon incompatibility protein-domain-containing protein [Ganoderma leucocontextum]